LGKLQKAGASGCVRSSLIGKGKVLDKQAALQELEKAGQIVQKSSGGVVFFFAAEHPPLSARDALADLVQCTSQEKGAVLWKEADLVKALTKLKHYTLAEATAAAKALCGGSEMLEVKDGKARKYIHRSAFPGGGSSHEGDNNFFVSEPARLIYALVELDGECRQRALGLTQVHYRDAELAKQWRNRIAMQIYPDVCHHPKAHEAANELATMFKEMTS
jgi:hypothetical protein